MRAAMSVLERQVLMQDIALELARLDKRLGKIDPTTAGGALFADSPLEAETPVRVLQVRTQHLQQATLKLLDLALKTGQERLQQETDDPTSMSGERRDGLLG